MHTLDSMFKLKALVLLFCCLGFASAQPDEQGPAIVVQKLFDAMSTHDANAARELFAPEAVMASVGSDGKPVIVDFGKWVYRLGLSKDKWLERMWNPKVLQHGQIATVWAEYDFHLNGKFSHCGVDSFSLLKTPTGWKIAYVADTREKTGCAPSPLGPPAQ